jgi:hypothetical protein
MIRRYMIKKIFLFFLAFLVLTFSFVPAVYAQDSGTWYNQSFQEWFTKVYDTKNSSEIFGERYTAAQVQWILFSLASNLLFLPKDLTQCVLTSEITSSGCLNQIQDILNFEGAIKNTSEALPRGGFLSLVFQKRALSGVTYFSNIAQHWHLIPEAKAQQGFGFTALNPILGLWRATRDITYSLAVIAILVLAFMIMFRVKISPQTVITAQSAIPKIAIALILITFSYAIAGFLIDLVYVIIGLLSLIVSNSQVLTFTQPEAFKVLTEGYLGLGGVGAIAVYGAAFSIVLLATIFTIGGGSTVGTIATIVLGPLIFVIILVLAIVFLFGAVKLLWLLLKTYVNILLLIIAAPLQIGIGIFSTSSGFGSWLRGLAANLAVYPVVGALFMVALVFLKGAFVLAKPDVASAIGINGEAFASGVWNPPLTLGATAAGGGLLWLVASLVVILIIPKTADIIKGMIEGKPFGFGTAIGEAMAPAVGAGKLVGLYGAGKAVEIGEKTSHAEGSAPPVWTQMVRRITGLRR